MKKIFRNLIFYTLALYLVSLIIPGFDIKSDWRGLILCGATFALVFSLVNPVLKLLLLPLNVLTLGLFSFLSQVLTVYIYLWFFPEYIKISSWFFKGWTIPIVQMPVPPFTVSEFLTITVSTFIISFVVSTLSAFL
jgi:putative membrane protein